MKRVTIDPITRLEGHGKIEIFLDEKGDVANAYLQIPELRGFERFCVGRPVEEMPNLTARICGVCPEAHHMAATKALDAVFHVDPPETAKKLRELFYSIFFATDHTTHFYALGGPDFVVGPDAPKAERNILGVVKKVGLEIGGQVIKMRHVGHSLIQMIGGRRVHPNWGLPGGVSKGITEEQRREIEAAGREPRQTVAELDLPDGAAVVSVSIEGAQHEFSTLPGVYEDVTDIILNVKNLLVVLYDSDSARLKVRAEKKGEIRAADIQHGPEVRIVNPDLLIATLTQDVPFNMELVVRRGRGYRTAEENARGDTEIGVIWVDSSFSPVKRVRYKTEDTRVGQLTNYDRLILEIWTNGTVAPEMALVEAAKILRKHLNPFVQYADIGEVLQCESGLSGDESVAAPEGEELRRKLEMPVSSLDLTVRAQGCMEAHGIKTVGDLVKLREADLLKLRNFGKITLMEVKTKLRDLGMYLGMEIPSGETADKTS